jgi:hypothetical protein
LFLYYLVLGGKRGGRDKGWEKKNP